MMSVTMDLAALCDVWTCNDTNGIHLAVFSVDMAFSLHFVAPHPSPPSRPIKLLVVLAMPVTNYIKWQGIQLPICSGV